MFLWRSSNRVQKRSHHKKLSLHFSVLDTMYRWSMMKNIHRPNLMRIGSWGPEIWPHKYLISPIEISVNWPGSKQLWTRSIHTVFNGANKVFGFRACSHISGHHEPNSCQIWCARVIHHVLLKCGHENAEMKKKWKKNVTLQYSMANGCRFHGNWCRLDNITPFKCDCKKVSCKYIWCSKNRFVCLFVYLGRSVGGHMLVHEHVMDRPKVIQKYKSG